MGEREGDRETDGGMDVTPLLLRPSVHRNSEECGRKGTTGMLSALGTACRDDVVSSMGCRGRAGGGRGEEGGVASPGTGGKLSAVRNRSASDGWDGWGAGWVGAVQPVQNTRSMHLERCCIARRSLFVSAARRVLVRFSSDEPLLL